MAQYPMGHQCPRCKNLLTPGEHVCRFCGQAFAWGPIQPPPVSGTAPARRTIHPLGFAALGLMGFCFVLMIVGMFLPNPPDDSDKLVGSWKGSDGTTILIRDKSHLTVEKGGLLVTCTWGIDYESGHRMLWTIPEAVNGAEYLPKMDDINSSTLTVVNPDSFTLGTVRGGDVTYTRVR